MRERKRIDYLPLRWGAQEHEARRQGHGMTEKRASRLKGM